MWEWVDFAFFVACLAFAGFVFCELISELGANKGSPLEDEFDS